MSTKIPTGVLPFREIEQKPHRDRLSSYKTILEHLLREFGPPNEAHSEIGLISRIESQRELFKAPDDLKKAIRKRNRLEHADGSVTHYELERAALEVKHAVLELLDHPRVSVDTRNYILGAADATPVDPQPVPEPATAASLVTAKRPPSGNPIRVGDLQPELQEARSQDTRSFSDAVAELWALHPNQTRLIIGLLAVAVVIAVGVLPRVDFTPEESDHALLSQATALLVQRRELDALRIAEGRSFQAPFDDIRRQALAISIDKAHASAQDGDVTAVRTLAASYGNAPEFRVVLDLAAEQRAFHDDLGTAQAALVSGDFGAVRQLADKWSPSNEFDQLLAELPEAISRKARAFDASRASELLDSGEIIAAVSITSEYERESEFLQIWDRAREAAISRAEAAATIGQPAIVRPLAAAFPEEQRLHDLLLRAAETHDEQQAVLIAQHSFDAGDYKAVVSALERYSTDEAVSLRHRAQKVIDESVRDAASRKRFREGSWTYQIAELTVRSPEPVGGQLSARVRAAVAQRLGRLKGPAVSRDPHSDHPTDMVITPMLDVSIDRRGRSSSGALTSIITVTLTVEGRPRVTAFRPVTRIFKKNGSVYGGVVRSEAIETIVDAVLDMLESDQAFERDFDTTLVGGTS